MFSLTSEITDHLKLDNISLKKLQSSEKQHLAFGHENTNNHHPEKSRNKEKNTESHCEENFGKGQGDVGWKRLLTAISWGSSPGRPGQQVTACQEEQGCGAGEARALGPLAPRLSGHTYQAPQLPSASLSPSRARNMAC